ncbi:Toll-like receptor, partial [Desmophyllum pertusum]
KWNLTYDAFIIYSTLDADWVLKNPSPALEEKHGLKCCVHYRDFTLGIPFRDNMVESVYKSRKTVAVVSNNFFNSNYCGSELDLALHRPYGKKRIIVCWSSNSMMSIEPNFPSS